MSIFGISGSAASLEPEHIFTDVLTRDTVGIVDVADSTELQATSDTAQVFDLDEITAVNALTAGAAQYVTYELQEGWNIIGSVLPHPQDMQETWEGIDNQIEIWKNNAAQIYWPEFNFNGIGDFLPGQGYQVKTSEAVTFTVPLLGANAAINTQIIQNRAQRFHEQLMAVETTLLEGWNIIAFNRKQPQDAKEAFRNCIVNGNVDDITHKVAIIKNNAAQIYWPEFDFNGIGDLIPGQGYQIKMLQEVTNFKFAEDTFDDSSIFVSPGII